MSRRRSVAVLAAGLVMASQLTYSSAAEAVPAGHGAGVVAQRQGPTRAAAASTPADYAYDAAGQLRGVSHSADGAGAAYSYDAAGNPTGVTRSPAGAVTVTAMSPSRAPVGATVTISGTGFATSPAGNAVRFNGTAATVTSATAARLVVTVPSGATSGAVTVGVGTSTATSTQAFTVTAATPAPAISGFSPTSGDPGTSVVISGSGFSATPAENNVAFGKTRARVRTATPTSLTVDVPAAASSGRITVATPGGSATSGSDFTTVAQPFKMSDVGFTGTLTPDGAATAVTFGTAGKAAVLRFTGTKGQKLSLGLTGSTAGDLQVYGYNPHGGSIGRYEYDAPWLTSVLAGGWSIPALPFSGTYQVVVKPASATATGAVTATLSSKVTGTVAVNGAGTAVNLARAGQQAELTFDAGAGQRIGLGVSGVTVPSDKLTVEVLEPNGTPIMWPGENTYGYARASLWLPDFDLDFTTISAGRYTIRFGTSDQATGALTLTASSPFNAGALAVGTPRNLSATRPGQDHVLTFAGTAGQSLGLEFTNYQIAYYPTVTVTAPGGGVLFAKGILSSWTDLPVLPATGTYTIAISPNSGTGTYTVGLWQPQTAGALSLTGAGTSVSFTAGRALALTVPGTAGQDVTLAFSSWTLPANGSIAMTVVNPAGTVVHDEYVYSLGAVTVPTATAGTYRVVLRPTASATGSVLVTASSTIAGGALTLNANKTVSSPRLGQPTQMTFTGAAGQRLAAYLSNYGYAYTVWAVVKRPDGSVLSAGWLQDVWLAIGPLSVAGTYQLVIQPSAATNGSLTFALIQGIDAGATTVGGAAKALTASPAGRFVDTTMAVTANQRLSFGFTGWTFAATSIFVRLTAPNGAIVLSESIPKITALDTYQLAAGTYKLSVVASDRGAGAVTVTASSQTSGGAWALNAAKATTAARAGQSTWFTYSGTAGQNLAIAFTNVTNAYIPSVWVRRPNGTELAWLPGATTVNIPSLPTTGTYEILISPNSSTGNATATLRTRAAAALGKAAPTDRDKVGTAVPTQRPPARKAIQRAKAPRTEHLPVLGAGRSGATWQPNADNLSGKGWSTGRGMPKAAETPLRAPAGTTAVSGRVRTLDDQPLGNVTVGIDGIRVRTDARGQFLVPGVKPGHKVLRVDGTSASTRESTFGLHDIGVDLAAGQTTVLPYTIWLAKLDLEHTVKFDSPTKGEVTIGTPAIPGLEVKLPAGAVVRDVNGKVVTELGITAIPTDRAPFPLPRSQVPSYFTVQPGSSYIFPAGAKVIYPNFTKAAPGAQMDFWHYDPAGKGWFVYGKGTVTPDGKRVVPNKGTEVYQFTGAMLITPGEDAPPEAQPQPAGGGRGGDPVDLGTGTFIDSRVDLSVDDVMPISVTRTYQQNDTGRRAFGIGAKFDYSLDLYSTNRFYDCWLILPDGGRIKFNRISPGGEPPNGYINGVFAAEQTPSIFGGSILAWNGDGWDLRLRNGTTYLFGDESPLQGIRDKFGNTITITRAPSPAWTDGIVRSKGPITQITSPNGKWIKFSYDDDNRVTKAEDVLGRSVNYTYEDGRLKTVTDVNGKPTTYTYESGRMKTIRDARNTVYLTNEYDANGRVVRQVMPGNTTYEYDYTTDAAGRITATELTDPRGHVRRTTFDAGGFTTSETEAYGTSAAYTVTIHRDPATHLPVAYVDPLNRRTELTYDAAGNVATKTEMAGTDKARTHTVERNGPFGQISKITDPLQHSITYGYQPDGALHTVTDAMNRRSVFDTNEVGQVIKTTDKAQKSTQYGYQLGDQITVTDPLGNVRRVFPDAAGRVLRSTDAHGNVTTRTWDADGRLRTQTDGLGRTDEFEYDANGNLHKVTDARDNTTVYDWDTSDRLSTITDPLNRVTRFTYDKDGNPATILSAAGKLTVYGFDALDRMSSVRFGVDGEAEESEVGYAYDAGGRLRTITDSAAGTVTLTPDDFDRTAQVTDVGGTVSYTYDNADRRRTMSVAGLPDTTYTYNDADQLTAVTRGTQTASVAYDTAGRRDTLTLPGGVVQDYGYDDASRLTGITYKHGSSTLGAIGYTLDNLGRPIHVDGAFARIDLPEASGPVTYDAADQRGGNTYDDDGNLVSDGTATYAWNARNELTTYTSGGKSVTFTYDAFGRRASRTADGTTTSYLYDVYNPLQERRAGAVSATVLTGGLDEVYARSASGGSQSLLTDALGSTIATADGAAVAAEYTYDPFGATTSTGNDLGNPTRFAGREDDGDGLYNYRSRYYAPGQQQFVSRDRIGLEGGINPYAYVDNQPTSLVDPMGTKPKNPNCGGGGPNLPDEDPDDEGRRIVEETAQEMADKGEDELNKRLSQEQEDAIKREGEWLRKIFHGSEVHKMTAEELELKYPGRFKYRTVGPDFVDTKTGRKIELTTPGAVAAHKAKGKDPKKKGYDPDYLTCDYATYKWKP